MLREVMRYPPCPRSLPRKPLHLPVVLSLLAVVGVRPVTGGVPVTKGAVSLSNGAGFVRNAGQFDSQVLFRLGCRNGAVWITRNALVFDALNEQKKRHVVQQRFVGAQTEPEVEVRGPLPGTFSYFRGPQSNWTTNVTGYNEVVLRNVWSGISLRLYQKDGGLEQEFLVDSGADIRALRVEFQGINGLEVADDGSLAIATPLGSLRESPPKVYQQDGATRQTIRGSFKLLSSASYTFELGPYDPNRELVIDPTLSYASYFGGSAGDRLESVATDAQGNIYVAGTSWSLDFPSLPESIPLKGAQQYSEAVVAKFDASGRTLLYSVIFGGAGYIYGNRIALSASGEAYLAGAVVTGDFPTTSNSFRPFTPCSGQFLARLNSTGSSLLYSTCVPGVIAGPFAETGLAIDRNGRAAVVGRGPNALFTTSNAYQPTSSGVGSPVHGGIVDGYIAVFDTRLSGDSSLVYGSYLAGSDDDVLTSAAFDAAGRLYVAGNTKSSNFPVTSSAFQRVHNGGCVRPDTGGRCSNSFVAKFDITRTGLASLLSSTLLGGSQDSIIRDIETDSSGAVYVTGDILGGGSNVIQQVAFPITSGAAHTTPASFIGFAAKFNSDLSSLRYSTFLTQPTKSSGYGIAVDEEGNALVVGTASRGFTVTPDAFQASHAGGDFDAFFLILNPTGSQVLYSTLIGGSVNDSANGIALDKIGDPIFVGQNGDDFGSASADFPVTSNAYQKQPKGVIGSRNGNWEGFLVKFVRGLSGPPVIVNVFPKEVGNAGLATLTVTGAAFRTGVIAKLDCPGKPALLSEGIEIQGGGAVLFARFNFVGVDAGSCSLTVVNADGTQTILAPAFSVVNGGKADVWVDIVGRSQIRGGRGQDYMIVYGNRGNIDSGATRIWISFPTFLAWDISPSFPWSASGQLAETALVAFDVPLVRPHGNYAVPIRIRAPDTPDFAHRRFKIGVLSQSIE